MKRKVSFILRKFYLCFASYFLLCQSVQAADFSKLVILHTNDSHGYDISEENHMGMAIISQIKKNMTDQGFNVLLLDAGDIIQGHRVARIDYGKSIIGYMNEAGYDAATLGNHEFDYTQKILKSRIKEAKFPFVSCNILYEKNDENFIKPYVILDKPYGKIGIIGLTTPSTMVDVLPENLKGLKFLEKEKLYEITQKYVDELLAEGCELIICLGHLGSGNFNAGNRSEDILKNVKGINIFIDGHDHQVKNDYVDGVLRAESGCYTANLGCIVFEDGKWQEKIIPCGEFTEADPKIQKLEEKIVKKIQKKYGSVIGEANVALDGSRKPGVRDKEMNIGDFCADAYLWQGRNWVGEKIKVEAAIVNGGNIRTSLPKGKVTMQHLIDILPFGSELNIVQIKGSKLHEILEASTAYTPDELGGFPQVSGIEYSLDTTVPFEKGEKYPNSIYFKPASIGSRVKIISVGGKPFSPDEVYTLCMTTFIVQGGDSYGGLLEEGAIISSRNTGIQEFEVLVNYLTKGLGGVIGEEYKDSQNRIHIK